MVPLICALTNGWANSRDAGDLWRHRAHYDVTVMNDTRNMNVSGYVYSRESLHLWWATRGRYQVFSDEIQCQKLRSSTVQHNPPPSTSQLGEWTVNDPTGVCVGSISNCIGCFNTAGSRSLILIWINTIGDSDLAMHRDKSLKLIFPWCHIYASVTRVSSGSDNGLSPIWRQSII